MARVLVIDDEEVVRDLVSEVLAGAGHDVVTASDGGAGLAAYRESPFDLVITDILMPVMDGLAVIQELKRDYPAVPIIAMAAMGDRALQDAQSAGADLTLPKPFRIDRLGETVSTALRTNG